MQKYSIDDRSKIELGKVWKLNEDIKDERFYKYIIVDTAEGDSRHKIRISDDGRSWEKDQLLTDDFHIKTYYHPLITENHNRKVEMEKIYILRGDVSERDKKSLEVMFPFKCIVKFLKPHMMFNGKYLCHGSVEGEPFMLLGNHVPAEWFERFYVPYEIESSSRLRDIQ